MTTSPLWRRHDAAIAACRRCPRLVAWRQRVAAEKVRRFAEDDYWGRPVPGFGDVNARLLIAGLAPAAHGGNRTGRMFTGDRSGDWLYEALHRFGFANQPTSVDRHDGLRLRDVYITAACRCAPPDNKPTIGELDTCRPFFEWEVQHLRRVRVILGLGKIGFDTAASLLGRHDPFIKSSMSAADVRPPKTEPLRHRFPAFSHGVLCETRSGVILIGSYHPSQQNTFTGRLTRPMFHAIFRRIRRILDRS